MERSESYLVACDGEIEEDYGDIYTPDESYQDFLDRNNRIIEEKNVNFYNSDWVNNEIKRLQTESFIPYLETLKKLDEKEIYKFIQKVNVLNCLMYLYRGDLPDLLEYRNGYDPEKLITAIENILGGDILKYSIVRIYNTILRNRSKKEI